MARMCRGLDHLHTGAWGHTVGHDPPPAHPTGSWLMEVLVLEPDVRVRTALSPMLRARGSRVIRVHHAWTWGGVLHQVAASRADIAVVDPWDYRGDRPALSEIRELTRHLGWGAVVGYTASMAWEAVDRIALADLGIPMLTLDVDDGPGMRYRSLGAAAASALFLQKLRRALAECRAPEAVEFVFCAMDCRSAPRGVSAIARRFRVCDRELRRRASRLGVASPRELQRWGRIFVAMALGRMGVRPYSSVAAHLGYQDDASLHRLFRQTLNRTLADVLASGAEEQRVMDLFLSSVTS